MIMRRDQSYRSKNGYFLKENILEELKLAPRIDFSNVMDALLQTRIVASVFGNECLGVGGVSGELV